MSDIGLPINCPPECATAAASVDLGNTCGRAISRWRLCQGPAGHEGDCANPWYPPSQSDLGH